MGFDEIIDTRNTQGRYERLRARFHADENVSTRNKALVESYLRDCALGKTVLGRTKKKIGAGQCTAVLNHLRLLITHTGRDLDVLDQAGMEDFILALESGRITSHSPRWQPGGGHRALDTPLSLSYQRSVKISIRKFYKWLHGENRTIPALVAWLDTHQPHVETPALTEAEVATLIDCARRPVERALLQVLFDSGFRIGELLNVRLHHVRLVRYDPADPERACYFIRCPVSKTLPRTVALPMPASTKWLAYWLEDHPAKPTLLPDGTLDAADPHALLFPVSVACVQHFIARLGRKALGKRVYPHLFRHSSATYWANRLPHYRLCRRFGWSMTSSMPQHYIDQGGLDEYDTARDYTPTATRAPIPPAPVLPVLDAAWPLGSALAPASDAPANPNVAAPGVIASRMAAYPGALLNAPAPSQHAFPRGAVQPPGVLVQPAPAPPAWRRPPGAGAPAGMLAGQGVGAARTPVPPRRRVADAQDRYGDPPGAYRDDLPLVA
jgi:integrase